MNRTAFVIASIVAASWAGTASAQQVNLTLKDGRVTLVTQNASVRQILAEWERQGKVRIIGADRLAASQPLTLSLVDVSERQALDIVLRGVPGYMAADRAEFVAGASRYDRLVLLARTSTPVASPPPPAVAQAAPPPVQYAPTLDPNGMDANLDVQPIEDAIAEPPMPTAPVVNPYPNAAGGVRGGGGVGVATPAPAGPTVLNSGASTSAPPETQFDYANPQRYFDAMRQQQLQQQAAQPGMTGTPQTTYPGSTLDAAPTPTGVPTAPGTSSRPGIAPAPTAPTQQQFFNPYNLPPEQLQGNPPATATPGTPVEPDRAKYANPYVPQQRPPK